jgi:hypothetical protein
MHIGENLPVGAATATRAKLKRARTKLVFIFEVAMNEAQSLVQSTHGEGRLINTE